MLSYSQIDGPLAELLWELENSPNLARVCTRLGLTLSNKSPASSKRAFVSDCIQLTPVENLQSVVDSTIREYAEIAQTAEQEQTSPDWLFYYQKLRKLSSGSWKEVDLIFASRSKPDLIINSVLTGEIRDLGKSFHWKTTVYDGLTLKKLKNWWSNKAPFYDVFLRSLASQPERQILEYYYGEFVRDKPDDSVYALFPQVWIQYDLKTQKERGEKTLALQRADFVLFTPKRKHIIEVDGPHHLDADSYSKQVAQDREFTLCGWEVYRFGINELRDSGYRANLHDFFSRLTSV